jgi:hypothetical protein
VPAECSRLFAGQYLPPIFNSKTELNSWKPAFEVCTELLILGYVLHLGLTQALADTFTSRLVFKIPIEKFIRPVTMIYSLAFASDLAATEIFASAVNLYFFLGFAAASILPDITIEIFI